LRPCLRYTINFAVHQNSAPLLVTNQPYSANMNDITATIALLDPKAPTRSVELHAPHLHFLSNLFQSHPEYPSKPTLPQELWAQIITYIDTYSLWRALRRVNTFFRSEADRIFKSYRLPLWSSSWAFVIDVLPAGAIARRHRFADELYVGKTWTRAGIEGFSGDDSMVHYMFEIRCENEGED